MRCPYHDKDLELLRLIPNAEAAYQAFQICEVEECFGEDPTLIQCSRTATWRETQGRLVCDMHSNPNSYRELLCRPKQIDDIEIYVNGRAGNIKWSFVTTKLEWEFLVVKLLRNNTSFSTGFLRKMEDAGIDEEFEDENLHVINVIGQSHVCYCPEIIAAAKLLSEFHKDEVVCMSRLRAFDSIGISIYQRIDKYARYRANAPPLIFNVEVTQSFVDIVARYGSIEVGHNDLRFLR